MTPLLNFDWVSLLLDVGIDIPLNSSNEQIVISCPFHVDTSPSMSINIEQGLWICFAGCGQGTLITFLQRLLNKPQTEIQSLIQEKKLEIDLNFETFMPKPINDLDEISLDDSLIKDKFPRWVYERGFTKEVLISCGCCTNKNSDLILPVYDLHNKLVGTINRRRNQLPKYLYSKGFKKSHALFGGNRVPTDSKFVCVVEGSLDAIWLTQHGYPAVALLGISMSKIQEELLLMLPVNEVILIFDNDEAGKKGKDNAMKKLSNKIFTTFVELPSGVKDIQEVKGKIDIDKLIHERLYF